MVVQKFVKYNVFNTQGQNTKEEKELKLNILNNSGNYLVHKDILRHQLNKKQSTSCTKTRSEVRGGGRKPWRQKGTGRARAGSNRSPLWKGGGVIFGPKPKTMTFKLNKKERRLTLQTLFYSKRNSISVVENLETKIELPRTKLISELCRNLGINLDQKILIIVETKTNNLKLATKNLKNIELISASNLNSLSLLTAKKIILTTNAINVIKEIYCD